MSTSESGFFVSTDPDGLPSPLQDQSTIPFAAASPDVLKDNSHHGLFVGTYDTLMSAFDDLNEVFSNIISEKDVLVVIPPVPESVDKLSVGGNQSFTVDRSIDDDLVILYEPLKGAVGSEKLQVLSQGVFRDTSLPTLARTSKGQPVVLDYRSSNVSGSVLFTLIEITRGSLRASQRDQTTLVEGFTKLYSDRLQQTEVTTEPTDQNRREDDEVAVLSSQTQDKVLLGIAIQIEDSGEIDLSAIGAKLPDSIGVDLSGEELAQVREWLVETGCIDEKTGDPNKERVRDLIAERNLGGFYRRLLS